MKISSSQINLSSSHKLQEEHIKEESLKVWTRGTSNAEETKALAANLDKIELSVKAQQQLAQTDKAQKGQAVNGVSFELGERAKLKIRLLEDFLSGLTGKEVKLKVAEKLEIKQNRVSVETQGVEKSGNGGDTDGRNWAVEYNYRETYVEKETMVFKADGRVTTEDGKAMKFSLDLRLNREFTKHESIRMVAGNRKLIDPLVLNLNKGAVELSEDTMDFDLNADGKTESIATLEPGSAFLALDENKDGRVSDGSELFGPRTGKGFAELASYDQDGNGWIDEADPVFDRLALWAATGGDNDNLVSLEKGGIGAIYLGSVDSEFALTDAQNEDQGQIARSSIYLTEDGEARTVQKIDLKA